MIFPYLVLSIFTALPPCQIPAATVSVAAEASPPIRTAAVNNVHLAYRVTGPAGGDPVLLIPGIGMQLIEWPPELVQGLVERGFRVIAYEPRDTGASTHFSAAGVPDFGGLFAALAAGTKPPLPYTADDMTGDAMALLERLGIESVDVIGISGGATVGILLALRKPEAVRSLSVIAANSGNPAVALPADPSRLAALPQPKPDESIEDAVARRIATARALAAPGAGFDELRMHALMERAAIRDRDPYGSARQGAALLALGDLRPRLARVEAPTLVIHGKADPLLAPQLGREVAEAIPNSRFLLLPTMGHDIPPHLASVIIDGMAKNSESARQHQ